MASFVIRGQAFVISVFYMVSSSIMRIYSNNQSMYLFVLYNHYPRSPRYALRNPDERGLE